MLVVKNCYIWILKNLLWQFDCFFDSSVSGHWQNDGFNPVS